MNASDEEHEAELVVQEIQTLMKNGMEPGHFAILYRTNAQSRAFEDRLVKENIPYVIIGSAGFYGRKEVKDIIAYLRTVHDPESNEEAIKRILNVPTRFLGRVFVQQVEMHAIQNGTSFWQALREIPAKPFQKQRVNEFIQIIEFLRSQNTTPQNTTPAHLIQLVREATEYDDWLKREEGDAEGEGNTRIENLNELQSAASRYDTLREFLDFVEMMESRTAQPDEERNAVQLMTIHRSKGLEFPVVFLAGMVNGLLPHKNAIQYMDGIIIPESCAEERRLCYVGMTRAKDLLYLSCFESYQGKTMEPSIFFEEMTEQFRDAV